MNALTRELEDARRSHAKVLFDVQNTQRAYESNLTEIAVLLAPGI